MTEIQHLSELSLEELRKFLMQQLSAAKQKTYRSHYQQCKRCHEYINKHQITRTLRKKGGRTTLQWLDTNCDDEFRPSPGLGERLWSGLIEKFPQLKDPQPVIPTCSPDDSVATVACPKCHAKRAVAEEWQRQWQQDPLREIAVECNECSYLFTVASQQWEKSK